ncbi:polysaccharide pyruvyl transferase family protein [Halomonas saccharevitans]|uniref:Exopolysaccharide biosynthesis protein EpsI, predicted pyruvyl transferase n=1 Tax=Halomonas saccharevitans TaxID=416872 RepID=A0A1I7CK52_9GAMM|nr:polysaccharide pyruvyl transferase family protein [Halomonas saccharevitans]SFT99788.1 Exopolysaccharide biosynthesis protein EpsI, predicted pyruvyl transferase [Halomonas saccharevitans]
MLDGIKARVPVPLKVAARRVLCAEHMRLPDAPRVVMFLAADYGNIGDLAISAAQQGFLARSLPGYRVVPIPISRTREVIRSLRRQVGPDDLVTTVGGGNMGSLYPDIEALRQLVIRSFPNNRIICFPQTLDWDDSQASQKALARIVRTYSRHPDIHVFARESVTHAKLEAMFAGHTNVTVGYSPDIVLRASPGDLGARANAQPTGILLCMRDDCERALDSRQREQVAAALAGTGLAVQTTDTHAGGSRLDESRRSQLLADKLDQFGASRLVVTDRLHGMILAVVAGTPCMVYPNANHKIRQTWLDWLADQPWIKFLAPDDFEMLPEAVEALLAGGRPRVGPPVDPSRYEALRQSLVSSCGVSCNHW